MTRLSRRQVTQGLGAVCLGLVAGCGRWPGLAQPAPRVPRIARLVVAPPSAEQAELSAALREGMRTLGYVEEQNFILEHYHAHGRDRLDDLTAEVARLEPAVIVVSSATDARAMKAATTMIPIVCAGAGNLVASGVVTSHARPGGNVTGLSTPPLGGKQLQLLQDAIPSIARVAVLFDATNPAFRPAELYEGAGRPLGLQLQFLGVDRPEGVEPAFEQAVREHAEGVYLSTGSLIASNQTRIAELALQRRLPSMWPLTEAIERGGLMAYGPNRAALYRRASYYVDRIFKGTKPADLPIEEPREFDFNINLRTAQALGLTIPPHVLLQATEVIQ